ncbi:MAG: biotin/lipoyl-containing protein [Phenylobacterium sp.]
MSELRVPDDIWAGAMLPEGVLERWCVADGAAVAGGQAVAVVRVEDMLHDLMAPCAGRLRQEVVTGAVIDPGMEIGRVDA